MNDSDRKGFSEALKAVLEVYGMRISSAATSIWWSSLVRFDLVNVKLSLSEYVQSGSGHFAPKPADLVAILQANDGWIGAEEAWSIISPTLNDESITVFWTSPMREAFGSAIALQDDEVAARMAFKEVYTKRLADARRNGEKPQWQISPGTSVTGRDAAIQEAVRVGRLPANHAIGLLSHQSDVPAWLIDQVKIKQIIHDEEAA